jgi:hypothetical protein
MIFFSLEAGMTRPSYYLEREVASSAQIPLAARLSSGDRPGRFGGESLPPFKNGTEAEE